jgi:predicted DsbA family dithiol-disulfide isomerase
LREIDVVHTYYYTDPLCPRSWALAPALRKLEVEFGDGLALSYVMCGLAREVGDTGEIVSAMLGAAEESGMPVDVRLWLAAPPRSSYPACIAVRAAAEQGDPGRYLRRLVEGFMCRRRKLDSADALVEEARSVPGLDVERLRLGLASHGVLEAFAADLDRCGAVPAEHHSPVTGRVKLPSLEFVAADGAVHGVYGLAGYGALRAAATAAGASVIRGEPLSVDEALRRFGTMATAEVALVCDLPGPRAPAELWRLATEWRVRAERVGTDYLWSLA